MSLASSSRSTAPSTALASAPAPASTPSAPAAGAGAAPRSGMLRVSILRISSRSGLLGAPSSISLSSLPARRSAASMAEGRLVVAMTTTCLAERTRSSRRVSSCVQHLRSNSEYDLSLAGAMESTSSRRITAGAFISALANARAMSFVPLSLATISGPLMTSRWSSSSSATARASIVLPVPGGPWMSTPLGRRAPMWRTARGMRRGSSTTSLSSRHCLASPPTPLRPHRPALVVRPAPRLRLASVAAASSAGAAAEAEELATIARVRSSIRAPLPPPVRRCSGARRSWAVGSLWRSWSPVRSHAHASTLNLHVDLALRLPWRTDPSRAFPTGFLRSLKREWQTAPPRAGPWAWVPTSWWVAPTGAAMLMVGEPPSGTTVAMGVWDFPAKRF
mmetsp:Transcript_18851/g.60541  ORF Transcript_18851/g.60541 Transcript_18851/m.60541 type:complete len:391 (-) Transcript_18851:468-1640(-)